MALCLAPGALGAGWRYDEGTDPFDKTPPARMAAQLRGDSKAFLRRWEGDDALELVIGIDRSRPIDPEHPILLRIDDHPIQRLRAHDDNSIALWDSWGRDGEGYVYFSLLGTAGGWTPEGFMVKVIPDIDWRDKLTDIPGDPKPFDADTSRHAPEGLFLHHLFKGRNLFVRYTAQSGNEVTETFSLIGLTPVLNQVIDKTKAEKCTDEMTQLFVESGCFMRAIDAAQPWNGPGSVGNSPEYRAVAEPCVEEARKQATSCDGT